METISSKQSTKSSVADEHPALASGTALLLHPRSLRSAPPFASGFRPLTDNADSNQRPFAALPFFFIGCDVYVVNNPRPKGVSSPDRDFGPYTFHHDLRIPVSAFPLVAVRQITRSPGHRLRHHKSTQRIRTIPGVPRA